MHSQEATLLVHMILWAAKHMPAKASKREAVIMAAIGIAANQTAIAGMAKSWWSRRTLRSASLK